MISKQLILKNKFIFVKFLALTLLTLFLFSHALSEEIKKEVTVITINGVINANQKKVEALIIELDTPGGLDTSMRSIVKDIIGSDVPVIVYVSPSGSRAASAGVFITLAAHIAAMSPGTNIGAAHPVGVGEKMDKTMSEKATNDAVLAVSIQLK
jgi:membrane-bound serine protease (ClpP class)